MVRRDVKITRYQNNIQECTLYTPSEVEYYINEKLRSKTLDYYFRRDFN